MMLALQEISLYTKRSEQLAHFLADFLEWDLSLKESAGQQPVSLLRPTSAQLPTMAIYKWEEDASVKSRPLRFEFLLEGEGPEELWPLWQRYQFCLYRHFSLTPPTIAPIEQRIVKDASGQSTLQWSLEIQDPEGNFWVFKGHRVVN